MDNYDYDDALDYGDALDDIEEYATHFVTIDFDDGRHYQFDACHDFGDDSDSTDTMYKFINGSKDYSTYIEWSDEEKLTICINNDFIFATTLRVNYKVEELDIEIDCIDDDGIGIHIYCRSLIEPKFKKPISQSNESIVNDDMKQEIIANEDNGLTGELDHLENAGYIFSIIVGLIAGVVIAALLAEGSIGYFILFFILGSVLFIGVGIGTTYNLHHGTGDISFWDSSPKRGRTPKFKKTRIRKYKPSNWKSGKDQKLFY